MDVNPDFVFFTLIYQWISEEISSFGSDLMARSMVWVSTVALTLMTLWILIQGYRMVSGQSRESMMSLVLHMSRNAVIVAAATTMSVGSVSLQNFFTHDLARGINQLVTGKNESPVKAIDQNLAWTQVAMGAIEGVKTPSNDIANTAAQGRASLTAMLGVAGPPMTAGAMLLMYQMAMMLFIGLGPLFILCLLFSKTAPLFYNWLKYGIATLFAMAVLDFTTSIVMKLMLRVATAMWSSNIIGALTGQTAEGLSNTALQQGGRADPDVPDHLCATYGCAVFWGDVGAVPAFLSARWGYGPGQTGACRADTRDLCAANEPDSAIGSSKSPAR